MMDQLGIKALRPGPSGNEANPNHANYDEAAANPYPNLPDVLTLRNGRKVTSQAMWWNQRRPEIVEDFERELLGRVPKNVPGVKWEVTKTAESTLGGRPVIGKQLLGHVVSASDPSVHVDMQMTLVVPAHAKGPVPVMMMFGGRGIPEVAFPAPVFPRPPGAAAPPVPRRSAGHGTADRRWLGFRRDQSVQHSGRQRRGSDEGNHRPGESWTAAQAGRLGRAARVGVGRVARPRLSGNRSDGKRKAGRHRRRIALWQSRAGDHGVRYAVRGGAGRFVRRGRREAASPQLGRSRREPDRNRRVSLDGGQLPEVWRVGSDVREQDGERSAG